MSYSNMWPRGDWARRHLNWALILYSGLAALAVYVVLTVGAILDGGAILAAAVILSFAAVVWGWYLLVWNLKHKGRSLWNILWLLIPWVGGIVFLCISNKDQLAEEKVEKEAETKEEEDFKRALADKPGQGH